MFSQSHRELKRTVILFRVNKNSVQTYVEVNWASPYDCRARGRVSLESDCTVTRAVVYRAADVVRRTAMPHRFF